MDSANWLRQYCLLLCYACCTNKRRLPVGRIIARDHRPSFAVLHAWLPEPPAANRERLECLRLMRHSVPGALLRRPPLSCSSSSNVSDHWSSFKQIPASQPHSKGQTYDICHRSPLRISLRYTAGTCSPALSTCINCRSAAVDLRHFCWCKRWQVPCKNM